ncbi:hypothetical protein PRIPAC_98139 [Pristionchus pacificus]|uniref:C-type lectin n=1 Tax=Pristionchus pacificus TaxID=54126 RepID=A0A8R1YVB4_PRIPA|nr:hypothetical protein PRIPAC_98139 [Pristionchus pacificus]|eukprot:PDM70119.1 C-type lectin [Pristionchus pacificus]
MINSVLEESTRFVCLVPQDGYTGLNQLEKIFAQTDKVSTSFAILLSAQCIERPNESPWRIVAGLPVDLDCTQEFSLIFTSSQPNINVIREQANSYSVSDEEAIFVSSATGMELNTNACSGDGNVTIYTGAGSGVAEFRYPMVSWSISRGTRASRGDVKRSHLQNYHAERNFVKLFTCQDTQMTVMFSGSFDARYDNYVDVAGNSSNGMQWARTFRNETSSMSTVATNFTALYVSTPVDAPDLWDSQDNFVVVMDLTDPYCGCELDKKFGMPIDWDPNGIWLDMVIILDCSEAMGKKLAGRGNAFAAAQQMLQDGQTPGRSNARHVIYYMTDSDPKVDLTSLDSFKEEGVIIVNDFIDSHVIERPGLKDLASDGYYYTDIQDNYMSSIQLFCKGIVRLKCSANEMCWLASYRLSGREAGGRKGGGGHLIYRLLPVSSFLRPLERSSKVSYEWNGNILTIHDFIDRECLWLANCFCSAEADHVPYAGHNKDEAGEAAVLRRLLPRGACRVPYNSMIQICLELGGGQMVSIHDDNKAIFVNNLYKAAKLKPDYYWIGYAKSDDLWSWTDKNTVNNCAYVDSTSTYWGAANCNVGYPSVCEFKPCAVGHKKKKA